MEINFDFFGNAEKPQIILTKPTGEEIFEIKQYSNLAVNDLYNGVSQISFIVYEGKVQDFDLIVGKKYVNIEGYGKYIIDDVEKNNDGFMESKTVLCKSCDFEFAYKRISLPASTYQLWNPISPEGTILKRIVDIAPSWSIGTVDVTIGLEYRYFDIEDRSILEFLYQDVGSAYQCVFEPDYETRQINIKSYTNVGQNTDIFISFKNVMDNISIKEISNEIVTKLNVYGGNGLSINLVNPTGSSSLINWNYFKNTEFVSQTLIDSIDAYEALYLSKQSQYQSLLLTYKTQNNELLTLQTELVLLENEKTALETLQRERIQAGLDVSSIYSSIVAKNSQISSKNNEIVNKISQLNSTISSLQAIVNQLAIENNFTSQQIKDLDKITIEYTYQSEDYIITDTMTDAEKQDQAQLLYDNAIEMFARVSQPRFSFNIAVADFLKIAEFEKFTEQFKLASNITIEIEEGVYVTTRLISYKHDWDSNSLSLEFTNLYNTNNEDYLYSDLYKSAQNSGISVGFNKFKTLTWDRESKDEVTLFINSAINATINNLKSSENNDVLIDGNGIRCRQSNGLGGFYDDQVWIVNDQIAFTDDNWQSAKVALGRFVDPQFGTVYGVIGEVIVGKIIAGNNLIIQNANNSFIVDGSGATLTDASFTLTQTDGKGRIILDPSQGIKLQSNTSGSYVDSLYFGTDGRIKANKIDAVDGTFTGAITITGGTGIGNFKDAGDLAILDWVDFGSQVTGELKPENNATVGATWGSNLIDIPSTLMSPSGSGLFLSSTNLGFYQNGVWKTYMDNSGNFYLGGVSGKLQWNASLNSLSIQGTVSASKIMGSSINNGNGTFEVDVYGNVLSSSLTVADSFNRERLFLGSFTDSSLNPSYGFRTRDAGGDIKTEIKSDGTLDMFGGKITTGEISGSSISGSIIKGGRYYNSNEDTFLEMGVLNRITFSNAESTNGLYLDLQSEGVSLYSKRNSDISRFLYSYDGYTYADNLWVFVNSPSVTEPIYGNSLLASRNWSNATYLKKYFGRNYGIAEETGSPFTNLSIAATSSGITIRSGATVLGSILYAT